MNYLKDSFNKKVEFIIDDSENGEILLFLPGSFSTPQAWKPINKFLKNKYVKIFTSMRGYGLTDETRSLEDYSLKHQIEIVRVISKELNKDFHIIGHSMGALIGLASLFTNEFPIKSIVCFDANPIWLIDKKEYSGILNSTIEIAKKFKIAYDAGKKDASKIIIDFYGGRRTFEKFPEKVKQYCNKTSKSNVLDWMMTINNDFPKFNQKTQNHAIKNTNAIFIIGNQTNDLVKSCNKELMKLFYRSKLEKIDKASHFLISTHPNQCAKIIDNFFTRAV